MFTLGAWIFMGGGEDHHPQWLLFTFAAILIVNIGTWCFLRSSSLTGRVLPIGISFIASAVPMAISYLIWDWRAYYGLLPAESWDDNFSVAPIGIILAADPVLANPDRGPSSHYSPNCHPIKTIVQHVRCTCQGE